MITYELANGKASRRLIQQPAGFKPKYDFNHHFGDAVLTVNSRGHLLCWWIIEGNGDNGFALLKKGADSFQVKRVAVFKVFID